jgi:hypothetical protein
VGSVLRSVGATVALYLHKHNPCYYTIYTGIKRNHFRSLFSFISVCLLKTTKFLLIDVDSGFVLYFFLVSY